MNRILRIAGAVLLYAWHREITTFDMRQAFRVAALSSEG